MAKIEILSKAEEKAFYTAPNFSEKEQIYFFKIPNHFLEKCVDFKDENMAFILVQYGYFRATYQFFEDVNEKDISYIKKLFSLKNINMNITKSTLSRYYALIREDFNVS